MDKLIESIYSDICTLIREHLKNPEKSEVSVNELEYRLDVLKKAIDTDYIYQEWKKSK